MGSEQEEPKGPKGAGGRKAPETTRNGGPVPPSEKSGASGAQPNPDTDQSEPTETLAILPVRGIVLFPGMVVPLTIGRPAAIKLVDSELPENKKLGLWTHRDEEVDRPQTSEL